MSFTSAAWVELGVDPIFAEQKENQMITSAACITDSMVINPVIQETFSIKHFLERVTIVKQGESGSIEISKERKVEDQMVGISSW
jgi:hypothetical protein